MKAPSRAVVTMSAILGCPVTPDPMNVCGRTMLSP